MAIFQYRARADNGRTVAGRIDAVTATAAALRLESGGLLPIHIAPAGERELSATQLLHTIGVGMPTTADLVMLTRQMYTIAKAGLPWLRGLRGLAESTRQPVLRDALQQALVGLEAGNDLAQSLATRTGVFPEIYISMVRVGEQTGTLDTVLLRLAEFLQNQQDMQERVTGALRYPLIVIGAIVAAMGVLSVFVIPKFAPLFRQLGSAIPLPTKILLGASSFVQSHWLVVLGCMAAGWIGFRFATRQGAGRYRWHQARLALPVFGKLLLESILARVVRTLSLTLGAGLPMIQGLELVTRAADNDFVSAKLTGMRTQLESGDPLSRAAAAAAIFPPLLLQMMEVGEETGELTRLLEEVADYYQREVDHTVKNLSALIEPILMVAVGAMVLVLALGIFLPLWDMIGKVSGGS
jgi:MSHA biogenesis protein MshG